MMNFYLDLAFVALPSCQITRHRQAHQLRRIRNDIQLSERQYSIHVTVASLTALAPPAGTAAGGGTISNPACAQFRINKQLNLDTNAESSGVPFFAGSKQGKSDTGLNFRLLPEYPYKTVLNSVSMHLCHEPETPKV